MNLSLKSLRIRVTLLAAGVACVSLAAVGLYANHAGAKALRTQLLPLSPVELANVATGISREYSRRNRIDDVQRLLDKRAAQTGKSFVLLDSSRAEIVAAAPKGLRDGSLSLDHDGALLWTRRPVVVAGESPARQAILRRQRVEIGNAPVIRFTLSSGQSVVLMAFPGTVFTATEGDLPGLTTLRRSLFAGVIVAILAALALALPLSARITRPLERLRARADEIGSTKNLSSVAAIDLDGTTEVAGVASAFNDMLGRLNHVEDMRRAMIADIAHELRTPLTNVRSHIESIQDGVLKADAVTLASVHEEILGLQHLIDDLQDLALADQGRLGLDLEPVNISALVSDAAQPFASRAASAGVRLSVVATEASMVNADPRRMRQVIANLISNSLAHTTEGDEIEIRTKQENGVVTITVRDTGSGIAKDDLQNVFERFYRSDPSRSRTTGGVGLGLPIVRQLLELHGGTIVLDSEQHHGTLVRVNLPSIEKA